MKLVNRIFCAALVGGCLLLAPSVNAASRMDRSKSDYEQKEAQLNEQQRIQFDYYFAEALKSRMLGELDKAISYYANCLKIDPNSAVVRYELASLYIGQEDYNSALKLARSAVAMRPQNIWYQTQLAQIYQKKGMMEQACGVYDKLIVLFPDRHDFYYLQAALFASVEKRKEAIEVYDRLEKVIGITEAVSLEKERLYLAMGKKKEAYQEMNRLIKNFPHKAELYGLLADLYLSDKQPDKAYKQYMKILKVDPKNGLVHFYLSDHYRKKEDYENSLKELKIAFSHPAVEVDQKVQYLIAVLMNPKSSKLSDEQVQSLLDILVQQHPQNARVHALYADFYRKNKKSKEAREQLRKVVETEKGNYVVWEELLMIDNELLDFQSMYRESSEALEYFPEQPLLHMFKGVSCLQMKKNEEAARSFKSGIQYVGDNIGMKVQFLSYMGEAFYLLGKVEDAFDAFDKVLALDPKNVGVLNNYSYYLSLRGEGLEKAETMSALCVEQEGQNATYLDTYAWVLYCRGLYSRAKFVMEQAMEHGGSESSVIVEHYGDILYKLGESEEAMTQWKKAQEMGSDSKTLGEKVSTGKIPDQEKADE